MLASIDQWSKLLAAARDATIDAPSIAKLANMVRPAAKALPAAVEQAVESRDGHAAVALLLAGACAGVEPDIDTVKKVLPLTTEPAFAALLVGAVNGNRENLIFDLVHGAQLDPDCAAMAALVTAMAVEAGDTIRPQLLVTLRRLCRYEYRRDGQLAVAAAIEGIEDQDLEELAAPFVAEAEERFAITAAIREFAKRCLTHPAVQLLGELAHNETIYGHTVERQQPKVGRNELCPCGSGRKHKHCCMGSGAAGIYQATGSLLGGGGKRRVVDWERLSDEEFAELPYPDIAPLPVERLRPPQLLAAFDRFLSVGDCTLAERALREVERRTDLPEGRTAWTCMEDLVWRACFEGDVAVAKRQLSRIDVAKVHPNVLLRFNIAADSSKALTMIDSRAAHVARSNDPNRLVGFCRALIDLAPALSLLIARGMLDPEHPDLTAELLAEIDDLGDLLCLPLADPAELRYQQLADAINGDKERELGQQVARLERDLAEVRADKAAVESRAHDLADRLSAALAARVEPVAAAPDAQSLRDKVQKLERIVDQLQDERADLRAELARALAAAAPAQPAPSGAAPTPTPNDDQPVDVLALTRGTRALVVGGQGARPAHRAAIQAALELAELDWPVGEERQPHHYARLRERIRPGAFDFVLFLAGFAGHNSAALLDDCKAIGLPVVYVRRGYSPTQIARAISEQLPQPR